MVLALGLGLGVIALMVLAEPARGTHPRPKGATPFRASLVLAYKPCASPNRAHGGPLTSSSCAPPVQASNFLTVGTLDANGAAANSRGFLLLRVRSTSADQLVISLQISDVRCKPATDAALCSSANAAGPPDYAGEVQSNMTIRITDHYNGPIGGSGGTDPATVVDVKFPVNVPCVSTADTSIGAVCDSSFAPQPLIPPQDYSGRRTLIELGQVEVFDGGPDGSVATNDNTLFEVQGLFVP
jgi:hypothetical protein